MTAAVAQLPDLTTASHSAVAACTDVPGAEHDYRPYSYKTGLTSVRTSLRCVWCHAVACGMSGGGPDVCIEPYHHRTLHRTPSGVRWPVGGVRPCTAAS